MRSTYRKVVSRTVLSLMFIGALVWALPQKAADRGRAKEIVAASDTNAPPVGVNSSPGLRRAAAAAAVRPLLSRVQGGGTVRVIVGLNTSSRPEDSLPGVSAAQRQQARIAAVQDELLIRLGGAGVAAVKRFPFIPYMAMEVGADGLTLLQSSPEVASVEEDLAVPVALAESVPLVGGTAAWAAGYSGAGQAVAILDTGVDKTHPFLANKVVSEACYSTTDSNLTSLCPGGVTESTAPGSGVNCNPSTNPDCKHGTHVAGIAAGRGATVSGVAKDANIIAVQVFSRPNAGGGLTALTSDMIRGLQRVQALSGTFSIAAANLSIGTSAVHATSCDNLSPSFKAAVDSLRSVGVATVIASGNSFNSGGISFPACISSAISVGSTEDGSSGSPADQVSNFSNSAPALKLLAPGQLINSSMPGGVFENGSGTSMATPHVTGAWAVLKSKSPSATVDQVLSALTSTGVPVTDSRNGLTRPRIKVDAALNVLAPSTVQVTVRTNPAGRTFTVDGTTYAATQTFTWTPGSTHTIGTTSPQGGEAGTRFVWNSWSDGGAVVHTVAPTGDTTYTANFTTQYFLTMNAGAGGTVSPPSGWFDGGQSVSISAAPGGGFVFGGWSGTGAGSFTGTSNPASVTMNGPISETASFNSIDGGVRRNVALAANGATATASSTLDAGRTPVAAINGDRSGVRWASDPATGSGWHDATADAYPDWLEVDFNGAKTIDRVNVFSIQDNFANPAEPTDSMTFTQYGVTAFEVQFWDGLAWVTVPGGGVTGNNKVWRSLSFPAITVSKIRILVNGSLNSFSRIAEVEAFEVSTPPRTNVALAGNGGVATALSTYSPGYPASGVNNGDRKGLNWGAGGGWNDASPGDFPDWVQVDFNGPKTIDEVNVFTIQDNFANPAEPTDATTFTQYGITAFEVQFWNGVSWATVPGGGVTGNNKVWRKFIFSPLTTDRIRVLVNNALASYSRIAEVEAFESAGPPRVNLALAGNGAVAMASSTHSAGFPASAVNNGDRKGLSWGAGGGWNDANPGDFPDWVQIDFNGSKSIREIVVFTIQDDFANPVEPTDAMTFTQYGVTAFEVQYWDGLAWVTVPGGSVTGNNRIKRTFTFAPLTTNSVRVLVNNALASYSRLAEVEVY